MEKEKRIDVKRLIESKNKKIASWLPKFVIRYLERIIHQKEINHYLEKYKNEYVNNIID